MSFRKMVNIVKGTINNLLNRFDNESSRRLNICLQCENLGHIKGFGYYCKNCGCIIKSKITVKDEICNKWNNKNNENEKSSIN